MRFVYDFDEPCEGGRALLGGKGVGLAEMTQLGVPVPAGFTITTEACRAYTRDRRIPDGLEAEVEQHLARLEERSGKRFGDPLDPLLVSVRSGAAISMPGMMDTILNLGLTDEAVDGLAQTTGNRRFALDSYRRLVQMFGEVVDGVDGHRFEQELAELKRERGAEQDVDLTADDLAELVRRSKGSTATRPAPVPEDPREQLSRAVRAVFKSWDNPRAQVYRRAHDIPDDLGTAVNVVQMVFGNRGDALRDRRRLQPQPVHRRERDLRRVPRRTRRARTSSPGSARPSRSGAWRERLPEAFDQLVDTVRRLEDHYRDMQDIEFTVEEGTSTCSRRGRRSGRPRRRSAAVDMVEEGLISREEAIARIDPGQLEQLLHPMLDPPRRLEIVVRGLNASPGAACGAIVLRRRHRRGEGGRPASA